MATIVNDKIGRSVVRSGPLAAGVSPRGVQPMVADGAPPKSSGPTDPFLARGAFRPFLLRAATRHPPTRAIVIARAWSGRDHLPDASGASLPGCRL